MRFALITAAALGLTLFASGPVLADQTDTNTMATAQNVSATNDPVICRTWYHNGMLVKTQQCFTAHQWDAFLRMSQQRLREMENQPQGQIK